ncbi:hypothetical protein HanIR_Chr12g0576741 [Helianthus annuus]|nr:hypothetical protein HanIR_Chr12g0576741 [Helianthus annuus]
MRIQETQFETRFFAVHRKRFEVGDRITATEPLHGRIVCFRSFVFFVKRPEPHALVFLVNLSSPTTIRLWDNTFVP